MKEDNNRDNDNLISAVALFYYFLFSIICVAIRVVSKIWILCTSTAAKMSTLKWGMLHLFSLIFPVLVVLSIYLSLNFVRKYSIIINCIIHTSTLGPLPIFDIATCTIIYKYKFLYQLYAYFPCDIFISTTIVLALMKWYIIAYCTFKKNSNHMFDILCLYPSNTLRPLIC